MVRAAPRYDRRVAELVRRLDDRHEPVAEICRRVAEAAVGLGLTRPSSVHLRRLINSERARADERSEVAGIVLEELLRGRTDPDRLASRVTTARGE